MREVVVVHSVEGRMSRFLKRKDGWGKTANIGDAYDGRTESTPSHSVIEREKNRMVYLTTILLLSNNVQVKSKLVDTLHL